MGKTKTKGLRELDDFISFGWHEAFNVWFSLIRPYTHIDDEGSGTKKNKIFNKALF